MMNQCTIIGHMGADPDIRTFANGGKVANIRLAVTEKWKDRETGERREKTEWVPVEIFTEGLVGIAQKFLRKGSKVLVQGRFSTRKWQDQSGNDRYSTSVVLQGFNATLTMLDSNPEGGDQSGGGYQAPAGDADMEDSEIPF